jgi:PEP-CTERM motif
VHGKSLLNINLDIAHDERIWSGYPPRILHRGSILRLSARLLSAATISILAASTLAPAALADSFQFSISSSVQEFITNEGNESYESIYSTGPDAWGTQPSVESVTPSYGNSSFANISFSLPSGSTVTSATLELLLPSTTVHGTAELFGGGGLVPPDPDNDVSIGPTFNPGTSTVVVKGILDNVDGTFADGSGEGFDLSSNLLVINGNEISSGDLSGDNLHFLVDGTISATVNTQGYNTEGYVGGSGQANIPYTLEVVGTYSPVPEPSTIALLGTGILGLAGAARRKFSRM